MGKVVMVTRLETLLRGLKSIGKQYTIDQEL